MYKYNLEKLKPEEVVKKFRNLEISNLKIQNLEI